MSGGAGGALPPEAMREILPEFMQESLDWMARAETALLTLETDASDVEAVNVVLRAFHTIKGTSAFLGLDDVSGLAHDAESLLIPVRDGDATFSRTHADLLLAAVDATRTLLALAHEGVMDGIEHETPAAHESLRARMRAVLAGAPTRDRENATGAVETSAGDGGASSSTSAAPAPDEWTRVRTERLDQLVDLIGELVVAQSMVAHDETVLRERHGAFATKVLHASGLIRELQSLGIGLRMVPLRPLFQRMHRLVRELSHQCGKDVELITEGADTEIDRTMVEALADPLVHMIRNAVDHGIETAAERHLVGKPSAAKLRLSASHAGGAVVIEIQDDGRGLDRNRILSRAIERDVVSGERQLADAEVWALIFAPGLSTSERVTELSGRGVGMDVVQRSIESMRGRIEIDSAVGAGTTFTIRLPLTTAITDGLLVRVGGERYIVPSMSVMSSFRPARDEVIEVANPAPGTHSGREMVMVQGLPTPIVRLHDVFGIRGAATEPAAAVLVVIADGAERYALLVDELLGQQQFVAKPLAERIAHVNGLAGSAVLGDGRVGLILDPAGLREAVKQKATVREMVR